MSIRNKKGGKKMAEVVINYWQLFQRKEDKLLVLLGKPKKLWIKKAVISYLFMILGILLFAFIWISLQLHVTSRGYTISRLQRQLHQSENLQRMLLVEVSSLRSAERIEKIADRMGLIIPDKIDIIYIPVSQDFTQDEKMAKNPLHFLTSFFKEKKAEAFGGITTRE